MNFKLNGKPHAPPTEPPLTTRLRAFLEKLPDGELLDKQALAARAFCAIGSLAQRDVIKPIAHLRHKSRRQCNPVYFGNAKTIKAFADAEKKARL